VLKQKEEGMQAIDDANEQLFACLTAAVIIKSYKALKKMNVFENGEANNEANLVLITS
jgi:hypothetical protein